MFNRIKAYLPPEDNEEPDRDAWKERCEEIVAEMEHDRAELEAGRMTVEEFNKKY